MNTFLAALLLPFMYKMADAANISISKGSNMQKRSTFMAPYESETSIIKATHNPQNQSKKAFMHGKHIYNFYIITASPNEYCISIQFSPKNTQLALLHSLVINKSNKKANTPSCAIEKPNSQQTSPLFPRHRKKRFSPRHYII